MSDNTNSIPAQSQPSVQPQPRYAFTQSSGYLTGGGFAADAAARSGTGPQTGFPLLDRIQPFYPGLYCLGAAPALGKTAFALQLADQAAAAGQWVIYFSLGQSQFELASRSLARGFFLKARTAAMAGGKPGQLPAPSSLDVQLGIPSDSYPQELQIQIDHYAANAGNRMYVVHDALYKTVEDIIVITERVIQQAKETYHADIKPLVIADYLQLLDPTLVNGCIPDPKSAMEHVVRSLKAMQERYGLTVLAVSSLDGADDLSPVGLKDFDGCVRDAADVVWGLQLAIVGRKEFLYRCDPNTGKRYGESTPKEKREMANLAKAQNPREVDLVCLKNRYGRASYSVRFDHYPAHDLFWAPYDPNDPDTAFKY